MDTDKIVKIYTLIRDMVNNYGLPLFKVNLEMNFGEGHEYTTLKIEEDDQSEVIVRFYRSTLKKELTLFSNGSCDKNLKYLIEHINKALIKISNATSKDIDCYNEKIISLKETKEKLEDDSTIKCLKELSNL
jgi:hypothetical protein